MAFISDADMEKLAPAPKAGAKFISDADMEKLSANAPAAPALPQPEEPANPIAAFARKHLGMDPRSRFAFGNITDNLPGSGSAGERLATGGAAVNSALDRFTVGGYGAANRLVGDPLGVSRNIDAYREANPILSNVTDASAYVAPFKGPIQATTQIVERAIPKVAEVGSKVVTPLAQAARRMLVGAGTGAVTSAAETGMRGGTPGEMAEAGVNAAGTGLLFGAGTEVLGKGARAVINSRGGQARQRIEKHGGEVGLFTPGKGKPYDDMVTTGTTDADIGRQARASGDKVLAELNAQDAARKRPIGDMMSRIDRSPAGHEPENIEKLYSIFDEEVNAVGAQPKTDSTLSWALDEMNKGNAGRFQGQPEIREPFVARPIVNGRRSGLAMDEAIDRQLGRPRAEAADHEVQQAILKIRQNEAQADKLLAAGKPIPKDTVLQEAIPADPRTLKASELNRIRRGVSEKASVGTSVLGKDAGGREAAGMLRSQVNEGPYAEVNDQYSKASYADQKSRRLLGVPDRRVAPEESRSTSERVTNLLTRRGQNTITAGKDFDRLDRFDRRHPELATETAKPSLLRDKGELEFRLMPQEHGGLIDRTKSAIGGGALGVLGALAGYGHISPGKALLGAGTALALKNASAIEGRVLYPMAKKHLQLTEPMLRKLAPMAHEDQEAESDPRSANVALQQALERLPPAQLNKLFEAARATQGR